MKLTKEFMSWLTEYDCHLSAWFDGRQDAVHIMSVRQGMKTLEFTAKRQPGELYPELLRRIQKELPKKDVWKRFGTGERYEEYLHQQEVEHARKAREKAQEERKKRFKEDRALWKAALWNAQHGRFTKETALPYENPRTGWTPSVEKPIEAKETKNEHDSVEHSKKEN